MRNVVGPITKIQEVFDAWRELGSKKLKNGTELIARQGDSKQPCWMHAVFPRLTTAEIDHLESLLGTRMPTELRRFYSACGGMVLFGGLFRFYGLPNPRGVISEYGIGPDDIVSRNHELDHCDWKAGSSFAIAASEWDASVYMVGMTSGDREIVRVARGTGQVLDRIDGLWNLVADKLYRLDAMMTGAPAESEADAQFQAR